MMELRNMKAAELKEMARGMHISGWWVMKKDQLIEAIENNRQTEEPVIEEPIVDDAQVTPEEVVVEEDVTTKELAEIVPEAIVEDVERPRRKNNKRLIEYQGRTQSLTAWAKELGVRHQTLYNRIVMKGMDAAEAFEMPIKKTALKGGDE